jgi:hypothetical protein
MCWIALIMTLFFLIILAYCSCIGRWWPLNTILRISLLPVPGGLFLVLSRLSTACVRSIMSLSYKFITVLVIKFSCFLVRRCVNCRCYLHDCLSSCNPFCHADYIGTCRGILFSLCPRSIFLRDLTSLQNFPISFILRLERYCSAFILSASPNRCWMADPAPQIFHLLWRLHLRC